LFNAVVIPCYDEEEQEVSATLDSLSACDPPRRDVEVILVINAPAGADPVVIEKNRRLYRFLLDNLERWEHEKLSVHPLLVEDLPPRDAGVGLARKTGMDEALYRFSAAGTGEEGLLTSLDADTRVETNYLTALETFFREHPRTEGVSLCFEHPLQGPYPAAVYEGIRQYELHLRYFTGTLRYAGHPYAFHTIGSAFAVRARAYMRLGGMNKRQGGEDFYFLQKVIMAGHYSDLTATCVHPSPRPDRRVPFGTGPEIYRFLTGEKDAFLTYNFEAFISLQGFFRQVPALYGEEIAPDDLYASLPPPLQHFLSREELVRRIGEIRENVATPETFIRRFFRWFDVFKVIKYLNSVHPGFYPRQPVASEAERLLQRKGEKEIPHDMEGLLQYYRLADRKAGRG
jgi:glycosyltransferase involved in cell wall biosynthesis